MKKLLLALSITLALSNFQLMHAQEPVNEGAAPAGAIQTQAAEPPSETREKIDYKKLEIAKELSGWLNHTLQERKALVAVVGREGSDTTKKYDKTGMGHAGLAVYDPRAQSWIVYNLLNDVTGDHPQGNIWRSAPLDFFYGQKGYEKEALLLIPDEQTQQRIYEAVLNGDYKRLKFTKDYNLVTRYDTLRSLNCNKWILMNLMAARTGTYDPAELIKAVQKNFTPGIIAMNPIERQFAKAKPTVLDDEMPAFGPIKTVTVESLYRSDLFTEKLFFGNRRI